MHPQISFGDLATLEFNSRAKTLQSSFLNVQLFGVRRLWSDLYKSHRKAFWLQWLLAILQSIIAFLPSLCLFRTLFLLEIKQSVGIDSQETWVWALGIGISRMVQQWLEARSVVFRILLYFTDTFTI